MKQIKFGLSCLTFVLAAMGVLAAKANEKKRATYTVAYYSDSFGNPHSVTLDNAGFDDTSVSNQAEIKDCNGTSVLLWATVSFTVAVKICIP